MLTPMSKSSNDEKVNTIKILLALTVIAINGVNAQLGPSAVVGNSLAASQAAAGSMLSSGVGSPTAAIIQATEAGDRASKASTAATGTASLKTGNSIGSGVASYLGGLGGTLGSNLASVGGLSGNILSAATGAPLALLGALPQAANDVLSLYGRLTSPLTSSLQVTQAALTNPILAQTGGMALQQTVDSTGPTSGVKQTLNGAASARANEARAATHAQQAEQHAQEAQLDRAMGLPFNAQAAQMRAQQHAFQSQNAARSASVDALMSGGYGGSGFSAANAELAASRASPHMNYPGPNYYDPLYGPY